MHEVAIAALEAKALILRKNGRFFLANWYRSHWTVWEHGSEARYRVPVDYSECECGAEACIHIAALRFPETAPLKARTQRLQKRRKRCR